MREFITSSLVSPSGPESPACSGSTLRPRERESTPEPPSGIDAMTGPSTVAQRYLLVHEYVGQCFSGWQKQPEGVKTVQSVLERAVSEFIGYETIVMGSSRTDTGVHALANTCHVDLCRRPRKANFSECEDNEMEVAPKRRPYSCYDVRKAINARIGEDQVRVTRVVKVGPDFHARFQAKGRTYFYRIACGPSDGLMSLFHSGQCWDVTKDLDAILRTAKVGAASVAKNQGSEHHDSIMHNDRQLDALCRDVYEACAIEGSELLAPAFTPTCRL